ncbi:MAG: hypothetical protein A3G81_07520 [Betaproteobacteria bacterium RIFCSPLOWO2_12_FULL_65_14]|nr:MAG: hypothetical protein A3G81_07520 [Betaproteobacteria bacterium RIFCSPLOWO2_12_FULL_65_14]
MADMILNLDRGELLRLRSARGATIEVMSGRVWITEDGCAADRFLGPGRRYRVSGDGLVLVSTENPVSEVSVQPG